jgi:hypothetical protein
VSLESAKSGASRVIIATRKSRGDASYDCQPRDHADAIIAGPAMHAHLAVAAVAYEYSYCKLLKVLNLEALFKSNRIVFP